MSGQTLGMTPLSGKYDHFTSPAILSSSNLYYPKSSFMDLSERRNNAPSDSIKEPTSVLDLRSPSPASSTPSPGFQYAVEGIGSSHFGDTSLQWNSSEKRSTLGQVPPQVEVKFRGKDGGNYAGDLPIPYFEGKSVREGFWNHHLPIEQTDVGSQSSSLARGSTGPLITNEERDENDLHYIGDMQKLMEEQSWSENTQSSEANFALFGGGVDKPDSWTVSHDSMELDSAGSTSGIEDLESILLLSTSQATDPCLPKLLLADNRKAPGRKFEIVDFVGHDKDYSPQLLRNSIARMQYSSGLQSTIHPVTQNLLLDERHSPWQNGIITGSGVCLPPAYSYSPCPSLPPSPGLSQIDSVRSYPSPSSFPNMSRGPSLPRLPSEMKVASLETTHCSSPIPSFPYSQTLSSPVTGMPLLPPPTLFPDSTSFLPINPHPSTSMGYYSTPVQDIYPQAPFGENLSSMHVLPPLGVRSTQHFLSLSQSSVQFPSVTPYGRNLSHNYDWFLPDDQKPTLTSLEESPRFELAENAQTLGKSSFSHDFGNEGLHSNGPRPPDTYTSSFSSPGQILPNPHAIEGSGSMSSPLKSQNVPAVQGKGDFDSGVMAINLLLQACLEVDCGNMEKAQGILVRLNQLVFPRGENSLHRVSFYFIEALVAKISGRSSPYTLKTPGSPEDIFHIVSAYKRFCEVSPLPQFAYFTSNQTILEAMESETLIHVIDFEVGLGVQWASFLEQIAARPGEMGNLPRLRLTVIGTNYHEARSTGDSLCQLANALDLSLDFRVVDCPRENLTLPMLDLREGEAIAVNFVLSLHRLLLENSSDSFNSVLSLVRQTRPKVVTVVELEANHNLEVFHERFAEALQYYTFLFDSLNGGIGVSRHFSLDDIMKIERLIFAPQIVNIVSCEGNERIWRHEKLSLWRTRLSAAGFHVLPLSDRNTFQAECVLSSVKAWSGGYEIVKDEGSLFLSWQRRPLMAASAWRC